MLVKSHFKGGSIPTAEILIKNNLKKTMIAEMLVKKTFQGGSILTAEMLGSTLTAEMLAKATSRRKRSNCRNAGRKQSQGGSILTAEMRVLKTI